MPAKNKYDVWSVNEDGEYHESGRAGEQSVANFEGALSTDGSEQKRGSELTIYAGLSCGTICNERTTGTPLPLSGPYSSYCKRLMKGFARLLRGKRATSLPVIVDLGDDTPESGGKSSTRNR